MSHPRHRILDRRRLFFLSIITIVRAIVGMAVIVFGSLGAYYQDFFYLYVAGGCLVVLLLFQVIHTMEASRVVCPSCRSQLLASQRCVKHKQAKKLLGSHRLRLAFQVVFTNTFLCQYCNNSYQWRGKREED